MVSGSMTTLRPDSWGELQEAGKVEVLLTIGGSAAERNVTLLFGAKDTEHNNARGSRPSRARR